jgi:DNA-binding transcriptional LysR family regulator
MSLDLLSCIKSFAMVAKHKSFSVAATQLHISTPVLTKQMQRLEDFLDKRLLHRTTRRVSLTEAGETYLTYAKNILDELQNAKNAIHNLEHEPHGQLIIGVPGALNSKFIIKVIQRFTQKYPKLVLQTTDESSSSALLNGSLDLIISEMIIHDKQFICEYLFSICRGFFASPKYIKKYGIPKTISDLKNHNCLVYKTLCPNNEWTFAKNRKVKVHGNYASSSGLSLIHAAMMGMGLISCPKLVLQEEINSGKLIEIQLDNKPVEIKVNLYYKPVLHGHNVKLFADYLKQNAAQECGK